MWLHFISWFPNQLVFIGISIGQHPIKKKKQGNHCSSHFDFFWGIQLSKDCWTFTSASRRRQVKKKLICVENFNHISIAIFCCDCVRFSSREGVYSGCVGIRKAYQGGQTPFITHTAHCHLLPPYRNIVSLLCFLKMFFSSDNVYS